MYPLTEQIEEEVFTGQVKCSECTALLCINGIVLLQYAEYNGTPERGRDDTDDIMWMSCVPCFNKNEALNLIESSGIIPKEIKEEIMYRHIPRTPNVPSGFKGCPGYMLTSEYNEGRNRWFRSYKDTSWEQRIDEEWKSFYDEQWFSAVMEIPSKDDKRYLIEILTIRTMIRLGWNYRQRLYRGHRYDFRLYGEGQVAELHKNIKMGLCCINCGGGFPQQYQVNPEWNGLACGNCANDKQLKLSIQQHLGLINEGD